MKLLRIATLTFEQPLDATSIFTSEFGYVKLTCTRATLRWKPNDRGLVIAEMGLLSGISIAIRHVEFISAGRAADL